MMPIEDIIVMANAFAEYSGVSSTQLCLDDAKSLLAKGFKDYAKDRALKSLAYSVGVGHPAYLAAKGE